MNSPSAEALCRTPTLARALRGVGEGLSSRRGGVVIAAGGPGQREVSGVRWCRRVRCPCHRQQLRDRAMDAAGRGKSPVPGFAQTRSSHEHQGDSSYLELVRLPSESRCLSQWFHSVFTHLRCSGLCTALLV